MQAIRSFKTLVWPLTTVCGVITHRTKINIFTAIRTSNLNTNSVLFVKFRCSQCASDPLLWMGWFQLFQALLSQIWLWRSSRSVLLWCRLLQWFTEIVSITYTNCMHRAHTGTVSTATLLSSESLSEPPLVQAKVSYWLLNNNDVNYKIFILVDVSINILISN